MSGAGRAERTGARARPEPRPPHGRRARPSLPSRPHPPPSPTGARRRQERRRRSSTSTQIPSRQGRFFRIPRYGLPSPRGMKPTDPTPSAFRKVGTRWTARATAGPAQPGATRRHRASSFCPFAALILSCQLFNCLNQHYI